MDPTPQAIEGVAGGGGRGPKRYRRLRLFIPSDWQQWAITHYDDAKLPMGRGGRDGR